MKRIVGFSLCLVLLMATSCSLFNSYKEMNASSLTNSGGTAPADEQASLDFVNSFLGISVSENIAKYLSGKAGAEQTTDIKDALKAYLTYQATGGSLVKADELMRHSTFNASLGYKGPVNSTTGTADVSGSLSGTLPFDLLTNNFDKLTTASYTYTDVTHLLLTLLLNGELDNIPMGNYTLVQAKLKNSGDGKAYMSITTDANADPDTYAVRAELKLKMSNGFSLKHTDGTGVKFTLFADVDAKTTTNIVDDATLLEFLDQIKFTINVYNDANTLIGSETISLKDLINTPT